MEYVALIGAIVGAGISIYQGSQGRRISRRNARAVQAMSQYNASMALREARENSNRVLATSTFNAMVGMGMSATKAAAAFQDAKYNADLNWVIGNYNARLLEREEQLLWQEHDLAAYLYQRSIDKTTGSITATYAAAGIEVGNAGEAPGEVVIDHKTQGALQLFIMKHGAEVKAKKLLEAAATGRMTAAMESNNIMYQGAISGLSEINSAKISAIGGMAQGVFDAQAITRQGNIKANSLLYGASWEASQYNQQGRQQFMNGMIGASSQLVSGASRYASAKYTPTDLSTNTLADTSIDTRLTYTPKPTSYQISNMFSFENEDYSAKLGNPMLWDN